MNIILCSSKSFGIMLSKFLLSVPSYQEGEYFSISTSGTKLTLGEFSLDVESKRDWSFEFEFKKLRKIKKLVKKMPEQPVTITFEHNSVKFTTVYV